MPSAFAARSTILDFNRWPLDSSSKENVKARTISAKIQKLSTLTQNFGAKVRREKQNKKFWPAQLVGDSSSWLAEQRIYEIQSVKFRVDLI